MRCLQRSNGNLTTGPVSHWVTGHRWNNVNNYLTLTFEVCCTSKLNSPSKLPCNVAQESSNMSYRRGIEEDDVVQDPVSSTSI